MKMPVVAIVGRPNVGKSSLLNALTRRKVAIVQDEHRHPRAAQEGRDPPRRGPHDPVHHHGGEGHRHLVPVDGARTGFDVLLEETDPANVFFQMDVFWAHVGAFQSGGRFDES